MSDTEVDKGKSPTAPTTTTPSLVAQAVHVASIKTHVPITLDLLSSNYAKCPELFLVTLGKYSLQQQVNGSDSPSDDADQERNDFTVLSCLYGSISMDIFDIVMKPGSLAQSIQDAIENMFRDNKESRALQLEAELCNLSQGDLTITEYCTQLKTLADSLADVDQLV